MTWSEPQIESKMGHLSGTWRSIKLKTGIVNLAIFGTIPGNYRNWMRQHTCIVYWHQIELDWEGTGETKMLSALGPTFLWTNFWQKLQFEENQINIFHMCCICIPLFISCGKLRIFWSGLIGQLLRYLPTRKSLPKTIVRSPNVIKRLHM